MDFFAYLYHCYTNPHEAWAMVQSMQMRTCVYKQGHTCVYNFHTYFIRKSSPNHCDRFEFLCSHSLYFGDYLSVLLGHIYGILGETCDSGSRAGKLISRPKFLRLWGWDDSLFLAWLASMGMGHSGLLPVFNAFIA